MIEEIRQLQIEKIRKKRKRRRIATAIILIIIVILAVLASGVLYFISAEENRHFEVTTYNLQTDKIGGEYRIVLISDLHNAEFGEDNSELVQGVKDLEPDMILMCGDMVNKDDPDVSIVLDLCRNLINTADIYYIFGNHEGTLMYVTEKIPLDAYLAELGVNTCYPGEYTIEQGDNPIRLFCASLEKESYEGNRSLQKAFELFTEEDGFKIVASHFPSMIYDTLNGSDFDLGVAGHYHGGQIIIPGVGGLYHIETGFFPEYYGGIYPLGRGQLIVTRGLGNSSLLPRINNRPELVLIDING